MLAFDPNVVSALAAVAAGATSIAALIVAIRSLHHSKAAAQAALRSAAAAERSADAAHSSANSAARSADAEERVAAIEHARHQQKLDEAAEAIRLDNEAEQRARLFFWTEHDIDPHRTFGSVDGGHRYYLCLSNEGAHTAWHLRINNLICNGTEGADMPATADPSDLQPRTGVIPNRGLRIQLHSSGNRNSWDICEVTARWEDGLGAHEERIPVARRW